jgi:hypothetical protein
MFDLSIFIECLNLISMSLLRMSRTLDMRAEMEKRRNLLQEHQDSMEDPYPNAEEHQDSMKDSMKLKLKVKGKKPCS